MSVTSQVYYRKWRPRSFRELVGQEHVTTTLRQAIKQGRTAHAYLFCGPRGTGKTTTARVLAKALNCAASQDGEPDGVCASCQALDQGRFLDLIELDAASNRGIDEIRSIREKVGLAPSSGRYKVYIIDEAHMLTEQASNAFLKTLEEPPPHAVFVLCTTEADHILPTIISRCQRFDFRRLSSEIITARLQTLCDGEGIEADPRALQSLARASSGSLRDAENLLEQVVVSFGPKVEMTAVQEMLGLGYGQGAMELVTYLLLGNTSAALAAIGRAAWQGADLRQLHRQAVELTRGVLMLQSGAGDTLDMPADTVKELEALGHKSNMSRVMQCLKALGQVNMKYDAPSPLPLELAVVETSLSPTAETPSSAAPRPQPAVRAPSYPRRESTTPSARPPIAPRPSVEEKPPVVAATNSPISQAPTRDVPAREPAQPITAAPVQDGATVSPDRWAALLRALSRQKGKRFNVGALLRDCKAPHLEGDTLVLPFAHRSHLERMQDELADPQSRKSVEEAVQKVMGAPYPVKLTSDPNSEGTNGPVSGRSPLVRAALAMGGRIVEEKENKGNDE